MLKNLVRLETQVLEKNYQLICDPDSPIAEVKVALDQFMKMVEAIEADALRKREEQQAKEVPLEELEVI
jgi:hypothetical protein